MELLKNSVMLPITGLYFIVTEGVEMASLESLNFLPQNLPLQGIKKLIYFFTLLTQAIL